MGVNAASAERANLLEGLGGMPPQKRKYVSSPQKCLKSRSSEMLFSAFSKIYFVKKSIWIKCEMTGIFSASR